MLSKECSSKPLHLGFPEPPPPEFWSAHVCKYLLILTFAPFCSCWLPSSCLVPTWTTICICCCPLSWSCLMPLKFHCHLESKPLPLGLTVIELLMFSWKCPFLKLPGCLSIFFVPLTPIILVQICFRFLEILTVPIPLECMLDPFYLKYFRSHSFPFGVDC